MICPRPLIWFTYTTVLYGWRNVKRGGLLVRSYDMQKYISLINIRGSLVLYRWMLLLMMLYRCCTARGLWKFRGGAGWNRPARCFQDGMLTDAHTHRHSSSCVTTFEVRLLLMDAWMV